MAESLDLTKKRSGRCRGPIAKVGVNLSCRIILLDQRETEGLPERRSEKALRLSDKRAWTGKRRCTRRVDQLESCLQARFHGSSTENISALGALLTAKGSVYRDVAQRFYATYQKFPALVEPASKGEIRTHLDHHAGSGKGSGSQQKQTVLRFERALKRVDAWEEPLMKAADSKPEPLPVRDKHLLSRLYQRPLIEKMVCFTPVGVSRMWERTSGWRAPYRRPCSVTLKGGEQQALTFVDRNMVEPGPGRKNGFT